MGFFAFVGFVIMLVVLYRFLFKVPPDDPLYEERTRTGVTPVGAGVELDMVFGSGTPSLGPPPPPARLAPEAHTTTIEAEQLRPPWLES